MALDDREKLFVLAYIKYGEAYPAALEAGYKKSTAKYAYEWLLETLPNSTVKRHLNFKLEVYESIQAELDKIKSAKIADAEEVLKYLTSVMRGESQSEVVVVEGTGFGNSEAKTMQKAPDEKERLRAAELLGKRYGLYVEEQERAARIEKLKAETARLKGESPDDDKSDDGFLEALQSEAESVWQE